jgi:tRNA(Ile)-lysidine synthase TilS/MesJ
VFRGAHLLSVNGMMPEGVVEGVRIWRPMLGNDKHQILDFAHTFGTPYFLDTTPTWSTRGKLRNQVRVARFPNHRLHVSSPVRDVH